MPQPQDRERYIPLRLNDLARLLAATKGLAAEQQEALRQFCRLLTATFHYEYKGRLEKLKDAYADFDPDRETRPLAEPQEGDRAEHLDALFTEFTSLMERANFQRLSREDVEAASRAGASEWGVNMRVDFNVLERWEAYARGAGVGRRTRRRLRNLYRLEEVKVPVYRRLILLFKLRPHKRLPAKVDPAPVYLKLFKDIPKVDLEMLFPGARLQFPGLERGKLGTSLLSAVGYIAYRVYVEFKDLANAFITRNPLAFWGPLSLVLGYGYRQYYGYQQTRQAYSLMLTESLYYQNLDNNAGVVTRLLDEAEEQECCEAILGYFFLWRFAGAAGWTRESLDDYVELELEKVAELRVNFEVEDALAKLLRLGVVEREGDRYRAVPLAEALRRLDRAWDQLFAAPAEPG